MNLTSRVIKRSFDIVFSCIGLLLTWWIIIIAIIVASYDTKSSGLFIQSRIGRNGKAFKLFKIRTMLDGLSYSTYVTTSIDPRITKIGRFFRKTKIDELPQLINVFMGQMSFVGPRPDMAGFADKLIGNDLVVLSVRPGITGPATLKYRNEELLLALQSDPERYNRAIIFPDKVKINREYVENYKFILDIKYIFLTIIPRKDFNGQR
jgi:lipopolysaccharide/colanic/teichoic acid biosynthesis glycosyltransferase